MRTNPNGRTQPVALARANGVSLHRQVFVALREQIQQGVYQPGDALPNEDSLCERFGVSRITLRRAVGDLEIDGVLERIQGRGTFVRHDCKPGRAFATLGFLEQLQRVAAETQAELLKLETVVPPPAIGQTLGLLPGGMAVHAIRRRFQKRVPVLITEAWVPVKVGQHLSAKRLKKQAMFEILMQDGVKFGRVVQEFTAVPADPERARLLETEVGLPLVRVSRLLYDFDRNPVQHLTIYASSERTRVVSDVSVEQLNTTAAGSIIHDL